MATHRNHVGEFRSDFGITRLTITTDSKTETRVFDIQVMDEDDSEIMFLMGSFDSAGKLTSLLKAVPGDSEYRTLSSHDCEWDSIYKIKLRHDLYASTKKHPLSPIRGQIN